MATNPNDEVRGGGGGGACGGGAPCTKSMGKSHFRCLIVQICWYFPLLCEYNHGIGMKMRLRYSF